MSQATFLKGLQAAMPDLRLSEDAFQGPTPAGFMPVGFHVKPTSEGVHLSIKLGDDSPRQFTFSSEEEVIRFLRNLYDLAETTLAMERQVAESRRAGHTRRAGD